MEAWLIFEINLRKSPQLPIEKASPWKWSGESVLDEFENR